jgi:hypothetical protein
VRFLIRFAYVGNIFLYLGGRLVCISKSSLAMASRCSRFLASVSAGVWPCLLPFCCFQCSDQCKLRPIVALCYGFVISLVYDCVSASKVC